MNRHFWRRSATWALAVMFLSAGGCALFPESWLMNAQKLNRGDGPATDPFYSIPDPTPNHAQAFEEMTESDEESLTKQAD